VQVIDVVIHHSERRLEHDDAGATSAGRRVSLTGMRGLVAALAAGASLVGCASTTNVVATNKPGIYTVAASATGGRMAWARAHEHATNEAREYCEHRGMQISITTETVSGVQTMTEHASSVTFECHPKF
jgi:putative hemolysin